MFDIDTPFLESIPEGIDPDIKAALDTFPEELRPYLLDAGVIANVEILPVLIAKGIEGDRRTVAALLFAAATVSRTLDHKEDMDNDTGFLAAAETLQQFANRYVTKEVYERSLAELRAIEQQLREQAEAVSKADSEFDAIMKQFNLSKENVGNA
jgi:hypothetical protein